MEHFHYFTRLSLIAAVLVGGLLITIPVAAQAQTVLYLEDFEDGASDWFPDNGVWQVGEATNVGPIGSGLVAGTVLDGNYPYQSDSRFISPWITLPASPQDGALWLRFSQWFNFHSADGIDYGKVLIKTDATPTEPWVDLSNNMTSYSPYWTEFMADLDSYAGQTIKISFWIDDQDGGGSGHNESNGWYIDDVLVLEGDFPDRTLHTFDDSYEIDQEGWFAENGSWDIGEPTYGTTTTRSGRRCAGTNLDGKYSYQANSRLISPPFELSEFPQDDQIWLSFWSWSNNHYADGTDYGEVQIQVEGGSWESLRGDIRYWAGCWSPCVVELSAFAGQTVRLGFRMADADGGGSGHNEGPGWYIDDVAIREGERWVNNVEDFEGTTTGWASSKGLWQMGAPTSGPGAAHSGENCWATRLDGNYGLYSRSALQSTWIDLPPGQPVQFSFWHWFSFSTADGIDAGYISVKHATGDSIMTENFTGSSGGWTPYILDLSAFAGQAVQISFSIADQDGGGSGHNESTGWYLDDFSFSVLEASSPATPLLTQVVYSTGPPVINYFALTPDFEKVCIYATKDADVIVDLSNRVAVLPAEGLGSFVDTERPGWGKYYYWISGVDAFGHEGPVFGPEISGVDDLLGIPSPYKVVLHGSHPNPFNPKAELSFTLGEAAHVVLEVFDIRGRLVARLLDEPVLPGKHTVPFEDRRLASGTYLARIQVGNEVKTCKMMLTK